MSNYWESIAETTDGYNTANEFESAAYRLVTEQVLYHADKHSRVAYYLIERYTHEFSKVLKPLGIDIEVNSLLRYVYAKPTHEKSGQATVALTLIALVLRSIYDEYSRSGQQNDNGEVMVELIELEEKHRLATQRELPPKAEFNHILRQLKRCGIIRSPDESNAEDMDTEQDTEYCILIRPAIVEILGITALQRLSHWDKKSNDEPSVENDEFESVEV